MSRLSVFRAAAHCVRTLSLVVIDLLRLACLATHSRSALAAENLFLRKQLALFQERKVKPRQARFHPMDDGHPEPMAPVARCAGKCETRYADPLAPQRNFACSGALLIRSWNSGTQPG